MTFITVDAKMRIKRSTVSLEVPAMGVTPDHTDGSWSKNDIYEGEFFLNIPDKRLWVGVGAAPEEIALIDDLDALETVYSSDGEIIDSIRTIKLATTDADGSLIIADNAGISAFKVDGVRDVYIDKIKSTEPAANFTVKITPTGKLISEQVEAQNIATTDLTIGTSGARLLKMSSALATHYVAFRDSSNSFDILQVNGAGYVNSSANTGINTNTIFGNDTAQAGHTTGWGNTILGKSAGKAVTSANRNVFIGENAGINVTTGVGAVALGHNALSLNTSGNDNIAIGRNALVSSSTANNSVSIGAHSLDSSTTGDSNYAIGYYSLSDITTGAYNTGIGSIVGGGVTTGNYNVFLGYVNGLAAGTSEHVIIADNTGSRAITKDEHQNVRFGNIAAALAPSAVGGFVYIKGGTGAPTGAPIVTGSGQFPMYFDDATSKLYIYNGSWIAIN